MAKRKENKRRSDRQARIERKCDRILSELITLRQRISRRDEIDKAIERLHRSSQSLRTMAEREREIIGQMFHSLK